MVPPQTRARRVDRYMGLGVVGLLCDSLLAAHRSSPQLLEFKWFFF